MSWSTSLLFMLASAAAPPVGDAAVPPPPSGTATDGVVVDAAPVDAEPVEPDYAQSAPADVESLLHGSSQAYLHARARLTEHPEIAAEALLDRLGAVPPPGPAEHKRLLDVLASLGRPRDIPRFADQLRRAAMAAPDQSSALEAANRWRPMLVAQGEAARAALETLVADRDLPLHVRAALLSDLVTATPGEACGTLVPALTGGRGTLQMTLRRALQERARRDPVARNGMVAALDVAVAAPGESDDRRLATRLYLRAQLSPGEDRAFEERARALARDPHTPFAVRVGAMKALGVMTSPHATRALVELTEAFLAEPRTQASELLAWVGLEGLDARLGAPLATRFELHLDDAPRLAGIGYRLGELPPEHAWLPRSQDNPWPDVRQAALSRVGGPCDDDTVALLARLGGPTDRGGEQVRALARNALQALGRCGGASAMRALSRELHETRADLELRAEAARQLVRHGGDDGLDEVARALGRDPPAALARRITVALRRAPGPTPAVTAALCDRVSDEGGLAWEAVETLRRLHPGDADVCRRAALGS